MNINFGAYNIQIKKDETATWIYDIVRKKWVVMTSEEQVRQIWVHYLVYDLKYSLGKISVERGLKINDKQKRFDICVYGRDLTPYILIECKSPKVKLSSPVMEQLSVYNMALNAKIFIITNGVSHLGYELAENKISLLSSMQKAI